MNKLTLTIGIPAHNEEKNIGNLLESILSQKRTNYLLKKVYVLCDGCTDNTAKRAKDYTKLFGNKLIVLNDKKRLGKAMRLNQIYKKSNTQLLLTLDGDVSLSSRYEIAKMITVMRNNPKALVVGARFYPVAQESVWGKLSSISYLSFEDAAVRLNNGNNFYTLVGAGSLIRKKLYKSFYFPKGVISDQNYLYVMATSISKSGYRLAKNTRIWVRTVSTLYDWRVLGVRSTSTDKESVASFFGPEVLGEYQMPKSIFALSLINFFMKHPLLTTGSILLNIYIRLFPLKKSKVDNGIWEMTLSSKVGIAM